MCVFFFSSRRRHTILQGDWSSDVCSSDLVLAQARRVDIRLLTPWSSWEDTVGQVDSTAPEHSAAASPEPLESVTISAVPVRMPSVQPAPFRGRVPEFLNTITPRDLG